MWVVGDGALGEAREVGLDGPEIRLAQVEGREHRAILRCLSDITAARMVAPVAGHRPLE